MDPLTQLRALVPGWTGWLGALVYLLLTLVLSVPLLLLWTRLLLRPLRRARAAAAERAQQLHWTEVARLGWAARRSFSLTVVLQAALLGATSMMWCGPLSWLGPITLGLLGGVLVTLIGMELYRRRILPQTIEQPPSLGYMLSGVMVVLWVLRPVVPLALVAALLSPEKLLSRQTAVWLVLTLGAFLAAHLGLLLPLLRPLGITQPAPPRLRAIVERAAGEGSMPRAVYLLRWPMSNALALPLAQVMAFSDAALRAHNDDELTAIAAHELGHLSEPTGVRWLRAAASLLFVGLALSPTVVREHGFVPLGVMIALLLIASLLLRRLSHRMEQRADAHAHEHGHDEEIYARALQRLYRVNGLPAVLAAKGTHPHLYDRLLATGYQPDYERPPPPPRSGLVWVALSFTVTLLLAMAISVMAQMPHLWTEDYELASHWSLSIDSRDGGIQLAYLASWRIYEDKSGAERYFDLAEQLSESPGEVRAIRVTALADAFYCQQAQQVYAQAMLDMGAEVSRQPQWREAVEAISECVRDEREGPP